VQLSVLVQLLSAQEHIFVSGNKSILSGRNFEATERFHIGQDAQDIDGVINAVATRFPWETDVLQVFDVSMFASFPK
jgi:hypothetical protein